MFNFLKFLIMELLGKTTKDELIIAINSDDLDNLLLFANSATLRYKETKAESLKKLAEETWRELYQFGKTYGL